MRPALRLRRRGTDPFTGPAGEFYAAGQLAQRHWHVSLSMGGAPHTDLMGQRESGDPLNPGRLIHVQVKAGRTRGLIVGNGAHPPVERAQGRGQSEWFILVGLEQDPIRLPTFYIVPRNVSRPSCTPATGIALLRPRSRRATVPER